MVGDPCETRVTDEAIARHADERLHEFSNGLEPLWCARRTSTAGLTKPPDGGGARGRDGQAGLP